MDSLNVDVLKHPESLSGIYRSSSPVFLMHPLVDAADPHAQSPRDPYLSPAPASQFCRLLGVEVPLAVADLLTAGLGRPHPRFRPLADDVPLVLGQHREDARQHPAGGGGQVDVLAVAHQRQVVLSEVADDLDEMVQRSKGTELGS